MRQLLLGLSVSFAFIVGCLVGAAGPSTSIGPANAELPGRMPGAKAFAYKCISGAAWEAPESAMNALGQSGWELVAAAGTEAHPSWCFKRLLP